MYVVTPHWNRLDETALMLGHNICFKAVMWKIIRNYLFYPFLSGELSYLSIILCGHKALINISFIFHHIILTSTDLLADWVYFFCLLHMYMTWNY